MAEYNLTIEYLINENTNIKKLDEAIEEFIKLNNGKLNKSNIIYNSNKRHKKLSKDLMFNNYIITFTKFIDLKKYITNIFKNVNTFIKKTELNPVAITKYCSKKKDNNEFINKYTNNIFITNIDKIYTKYNKKKNDNIFDIKINYNNNDNNDNIIGGLENNNLEEDKDKYNLLQKYIVDYYIQNNIIN
jgi:hypothetical protein